MSRNMDLVKKTTVLKLLIEHLLKSLENVLYHLFTARWERKQWSNVIENLPPSHAAVEMDFSENLSSTYQEEIQSLH